MSCFAISLTAFLSGMMFGAAVAVILWGEK